MGLLEDKANEKFKRDKAAADKIAKRMTKERDQESRDRKPAKPRGKR